MFSYFSKTDMFPDKNTPNRLFNGVAFKNVPIVNIKVSRNNTIINLTDKGMSSLLHGKSTASIDMFLGQLKGHRSCGMEGFKNCRKGTNVAAQATAISFGSVNIIMTDWQ